MKLSIVIPARNEAGNIVGTITGLRDHLDANDLPNFEILVVNDGSTDNTQALVEAEGARDNRIRVVENKGLHGFGRAVAYGLDNFTGDAVVVYMADASDAPEHVVNYYHILHDEADCAFGSRWLRDSEVYDYPWFKLIINRIANFVIQVMFGLRYNDITNAFKGYRRDVIDGVRPFVSPHFNMTIELPLKAIVRGYSYKAIPISWRNREVGESALKLKEQGSRYLWTLLTIWFEYLLIRQDHHRPTGEHFEPWQDSDRPDDHTQPKQGQEI